MVALAGWTRGMDNRRADYDLQQDTLRDALNVDILSSGKPRLRYGPRLVVADSGAHSFFADGSRAFWATVNTLKRCGVNFDAHTVLTDGRLAAPLSYVSLLGRAYFSNERVNGLVDESGAYQPWGIVPPAVAPVCSTAGARAPTVQVTCTFVLASGEESGAPLATAVGVTGAPSFISVSSIPQSSDSRVVATRLYVTAIDGTEFYAEADVPAGTTTATLSGYFGTGQILRTQFMSNPPPGQLLEYHNGSLWIATGNLVVHTVPLRYGLFDNTAHYFAFPERVTLLIRVPDGVFVSADKTYFLPDAGTSEVRQRPVLEYRAVEGAAMHLPKSDDVVWLSERGVVRGKAGGAVENITEAQIAMPKYARAAIGLHEKDGHRAIIAIARDGNDIPLVSKDWVADDAVRATEVQ